jgi:hypothetical protein
MLVKFQSYSEYYFHVDDLPEVQALFAKALLRKCDYKNKDTNGNAVDYLQPNALKQDDVKFTLVDPGMEAAMVNHYLMFIENKE